MLPNCTTKGATKTYTMSATTSCHFWYRTYIRYLLSHRTEPRLAAMKESVTRHIACSDGSPPRSYHNPMALSPTLKPLYLGLCISIELVFVVGHDTSLHAMSQRQHRHPNQHRRKISSRQHTNGVRPMTSTRWIIKRLCRAHITPCPTLKIYYQLAFLTPGIRPLDAISRN